MKKNTRKHISIGIIITLVFLTTIIFSLKNEHNNSFFKRFLNDYILMPFKVVPKVKSNDKLLNDNYIKELLNEIEELNKLLDIKNNLTDFEIVNASVISRNKGYYFNNLMIDKGSHDGLLKNMAVITKEGLVGKISKTNKYSSEVKLITSSDANFKISVSILTDNGKVNAYLDGYDKKNNKLKVTGISKEATIAIGQSVITSGLGGVFPSGIYIGTINEIKSGKYGMNREALIELSRNFDSLSYLTILKKEIEK